MTIIGLVLMVACTSKSPSRQIHAMLKRVDVAEQRISKLYDNDFNYLVKEFEAIDNQMEHAKDISYEMDLMQAYLQQFETYRVVMLEDVELSRKQLANLKSDVKSGRFDDNLANKYIADEESALHKLEAQIDYFQEKFDAQKEVVQRLRKE